jgi:predicted transposase YbfD/YdcC
VATVKLYISGAELSAKSLLMASSVYWSVDNNLHWQLDLSMNEDACRIRQKKTEASKPK